MPYLSIPVAPHAGAWIEMQLYYLNREIEMSLPTRERGLKYFFDAAAESLAPSLPTRERGLKLSRTHSVGLLGRRSPRGSVD